MSLKREDAMTHAPDLLLLSQYDPEMGEVAAFEELIGSHGGLGGPQTEPFILHPDRVGARRAGAAGRAGDLPEHPPLAGVDRDRARQAGGGDARPPTPVAAAPAVAEASDGQTPNGQGPPREVDGRLPPTTPAQQARSPFHRAGTGSSMIRRPLGTRSS